MDFRLHKYVKMNCGFYSISYYLQRLAYSEYYVDTNVTLWTLGKVKDYLNKSERVWCSSCAVEEQGTLYM